MTAVEHAAFASPLDLLAQWRNDLPDGPPLRELLVLGYTVDLAFFERFCVPAARQLGARVTVLGDSARSVHDAVDVRFAGRAYQHGLAASGGAFHPKLAVLAGDEHLWMAIGSGNPHHVGLGAQQRAVVGAPWPDRPRPAGAGGSRGMAGRPRHARVDAVVDRGDDRPDRAPGRSSGGRRDPRRCPGSAQPGPAAPTQSTTPTTADAAHGVGRHARAADHRHHLFCARATYPSI